MVSKPIFNTLKKPIINICIYHWRGRIPSSQYFLFGKKQNICALQLLSSNKFHSTSFVNKLFGTFNPFKALDTWYDLEKLKHDWDPDFNLSNFKFGAIQALCTIVDLIQRNCWRDLRGLITRPLVERLEQDHEILQKISNTGELSANMVVTTVNRVLVQEIVDRKYCDIDISFRVKNQKDNIFNYDIRFHREYTVGKLPEWTITKIRIDNLKTKNTR